MGLLSLDYFRCEGFELNFRIYVFGGFWPLETNVKWKKILFSIFSFFCYFSLTSMVAIQMLDIYLLRNDFVKLTTDLSSITISSTILTKSILIIYKVDEINNLKRKFTKYKNTRTDPADIEILEQTNTEILTVTKAFYMMSFACAFFWMLYPALDTEEKRVPFPYRLPIEEWPYSVYVVVYVYQCISMVGYAINIVSVDSIFFCFALRIIAHYDIIIKNIKALGNLAETGDEAEREAETRLAKKVIKENVELHQIILEDLKSFEEIFDSSSVVFFFGLIVAIGVAIIDLVRIAKGFRLQILQKMLYLVVGLWDSFLYCFWAEKMQLKSLELSQAAYGAKWYNMKPEIRKDLLLISLKCQKVPRIRVGHLFHLNLKTFVKILKISYDITALLFRTMND